MADLSALQKCDLVRFTNKDLYTAPANLEIEEGQCIVLNSSGEWIHADASAAGTVTNVYMALAHVNAGESLTGVKGAGVIVDVGDVISALAINAPVYVSDTNTSGLLSDTPGTVSYIVGRVIAGFANPTFDRLLRLEQ